MPAPGAPDPHLFRRVLKTFEAYILLFGAAAWTGRVLYRRSGQVEAELELRAWADGRLRWFELVAALFLLAEYALEWGQGPWLRPSLVVPIFLLGVLWQAYLRDKRQRALAEQVDGFDSSTHGCNSD
jgi:hypothetical protein